MKLSVKIATILTILSVISVGLVGYLAYYYGRKTIEERTFNHLVSTNLLKEKEFSRWVGDAKRSLRELARRPSIQQLVESLNLYGGSSSQYQLVRTEIYQEHLTPVLEEEEGFFELFIMRNKDGKVAVSTNDKEEGKFRRNELYFLQGRSRTTVQSAYYSLSYERPMTTIGTPIKDRDGKTIGVLAAHMDLTEMSTIMAQGRELSDSEETYLVNKFNFFVTESRFVPNFVLRKALHTKGVKNCLREKNGVGRYDNYRGTPTIGAYHWLADWELCIMTEMSQAEAFAPIVALGKSVFGIGVGVALFSAVLGIFFSRTITGPVRRLVKGAEQVGRGNLDYRQQVESGDEIGHLSRTFNQMTENLKSTTASLHQEVTEHKQAEEALQARYHEIQTLHEISQSILSLPDLKSTLEVILDKALSVGRFDLGNVRLLDADRQMLGLIASKGYRDPQNAQRHLRNVDETAADGRLLKVLTSKHAWVEEDLSQRPWFRILKREEVQSAVVVPVHAAEEVLGVIQLGSRTQRKFPPNEIRLLEALGNHMGIAIQKARLYEETLSKAKELSALYSVATVVNQSLDIETVLNSVMYKVLEIFSFDAACVRLLSEDGKELRTLAQEGTENLSLFEGRLSLGPKRLVVLVLNSEKPLYCEDMQNDPEYNRMSYSKRSLMAGFRGSLIFPLKVKNRPIGAMSFYSKSPHRFSPSEVKLIHSIADHMGIAIENAQLYEQTAKQAVELAKSVGDTEAAKRELEIDIAERKRMGEELKTSREQFRNLAAHLQSVREEERTRMAREVHDELGQSLTALKMDLSWLSKKLPKNQGPLLQKISSMSGYVDETVKMVRRIATELRPGVLDDLGIVAAIEWHLREFRNRTGIAYKFSSQLETLPLGKMQSTAVFRILQETLTNVARHAAASQVEVSLEKVEGCVVLRVSDNGRGIKESAMRDTKSLGLLGMRERAVLIGGEVRINGRAGEGTTVTVRIPLGEHEKGPIERKEKTAEGVG